MIIITAKRDKEIAPGSKGWQWTAKAEGLTARGRSPVVAMGRKLMAERPDLAGEPWIYVGPGGEARLYGPSIESLAGASVTEPDEQSVKFQKYTPYQPQNAPET